MGIDPAKRTMEARVMDSGKIGRHGLTTDEKGQKILAMLPQSSDAADCEVCRFGNRPARLLPKETGCTVTALNQGNLRVIWSSRENTYREYALKTVEYFGTRRKRSGAVYPAGNRRRSGRTSR